MDGSLVISLPCWMGRAARAFITWLALMVFLVLLIVTLGARAVVGYHHAILVATYVQHWQV